MKLQGPWINGSQKKSPKNSEEEQFFFNHVSLIGAQITIPTAQTHTWELGRARAPLTPKPSDKRALRTS